MIGFPQRALMGVVIVIALAGVIDAVRSNEPDLAVVLGAVVVSLVALLVGASGHRRFVPVRSDLARWLEHRAAFEGEDIERLATRAVAAYRSTLEPSDGAPPNQPAPGRGP